MATSQVISLSGCLARLAEVTGLNMTTVLGSPVSRQLCANLSIFGQLSRRGVVDFEDVAPVRLSTVIYGILSPIIVIISVILNVLLILALGSRKLRSPINVLLAEIAMLDSLTGVTQIPWDIHTYDLEAYRDLPDMSWCIWFFYVTKFLATAFHTAALWLTVLVSWQRVVGVSQQAPSRCKLHYKGVVVASLVVLTLSFFLHSLQVVFLRLRPVVTLKKAYLTREGVQLTSTCSLELRDASMQVYYSYVYTWVRLVVAQLLPCLLLGCFNAMLISVTCRSYRYRHKLIAGNRLAESADLRRTMRTSIILLLLTSCTLVAELLVAVLLVLDFFAEKYAIPVNTQVIREFFVVSNLVIVLTFPANFLFFWVMSQRFRNVLCACYRKRLTRKVGVLPAPDNNNTVAQDGVVSLCNMSK